MNRAEFLKELKKMGFPVTIQGAEAYADRSKDEVDNTFNTTPSPSAESQAPLSQRPTSLIPNL